MPDNLLRVNLGAGLQAYEHPGYVSVDRIHSEGIDIVWDLENGLPKKDFYLLTSMLSMFSHGAENLTSLDKIFEDGTVDEFLCKHSLEHVRNLLPLMDEMWDALKPGGILHIYVPNANHIRAAWSDPTHVRCFTPETFDYWTHATLAAYPYTKKEWEIVERKVNGTPPDDLWEIEVIMSPVK
jgi:hypothetical protein